LAQFQSQPADLIVTDVIMPDSMDRNHHGAASDVSRSSDHRVSGRKAHAMQFLDAAHRLRRRSHYLQPFKPRVDNGDHQLLARNADRKSAS